MKKEKIKEILKTKKGLIMICIILAILLVGITIGACFFVKNNENETILDNTYVVRFDTRGGTRISDQEIVCGTMAIRPENPEKEGFSFIDWYYNEQVFDFATLINNDMVIIAKYNVESDDILTVSFDSNGGTAVQNIEVKKDVSITEPIEPSLDGYEFNGWYLNDEKFDFEIPITKNITLVAKWEEKSSAISNDNIQNQNISNISNSNNISNGNIVNNNENINNNINNNEENNENDDTTSKATINFSQISGLWYKEGTNDVTIKFEKDSDGTYSYETRNLDADTLIVNRSEWHSGSGGWRLESIEEYFSIKVISLNKITISKEGTTVTLVRTPTVIKTNKIVIKNGDVTATVGEKNMIVSAYVYPANADNTKLIWTSSNTEIVSVTYSDTLSLIGPEYLGYTGWLNANKEGTATITVSSSDGGASTSFKVTVNKIPVTDISLNTTSLSLIKGKTSTLVATITPSNASYKSVNWSSSNTSVATVSNSGIVTAVGVGNATITAMSNDGAHVTTCNVTVSNPELIVSPSIGYSSNITDSSVDIGILVKLSVSGGSGSYSYYHIKLYKDGTLIGQTTDSSTNKLFVGGHKNGNYHVEYIVRDSEGNEKSGISGITSISM